MNDIVAALRMPSGKYANWLFALIGLALLYIPTYLDLAGGMWKQDEQAHGPIILLVSLYLLWSKRAVINEDKGGNEPLGLALLVPGLLFYAVGRSQEILLFEIGSQILVFSGVILYLAGVAAFRAMLFPLCFLIFMVPVPGVVVDTVTGPLKHAVSVVADHVLFSVGYPISRTGVILNIGQYQLLVADACSGLNSMFTLAALGVLYLYMIGRKSWVHNVFIAACILPIAFVANAVRVIVLVLVTYHFGDEAGQGFVHSFAGMLLFVVALFLLIALDSCFGWVHGKFAGSRK